MLCYVKIEMHPSLALGFLKKDWHPWDVGEFSGIFTENTSADLKEKQISIIMLMT